MLRVPKREAKDYILQDVTPSLKSSPQHTPDSFPRVTQTNLGKYCRPLDFEENEAVPDWKIRPTNTRVLDKYAKDHKAFWVNKPGEDPDFLYNIYKKYSVNIDTELDPRYKYNPRIFQRSFKYELDSMEDARQELIARKAIEDECREKQSKQMASTPEDLTPQELHHNEICERMLDMPEDTSEYRDNFGRWQEKPRLFAPSMKEPCSRRRAFQLFKQPYKHEACIWYYTNYPPPNIPFRPAKIT